jgi:hypothetical protein
MLSTSVLTSSKFFLSLKFYLKVKYLFVCKGKGKVHPRTGHGDPEEE